MKIRLKSLLAGFAVLLLGASAALAQKPSKVAKVHIENAELAINKGNYTVAIAELQQAQQASPTAAVVHRLSGLAQYRMGNYAKAAEAYEQLFKLRPDFARAAYYECALAYMKQYEYAKALDYLLLYKYAEDKDYKTVEHTAQIGYNNYLERNISHCEFSLKVDFKEIVEKPEAVANAVNSPHDEYLPTLTNNGTLLVFTRSRSGNEDIWVSKLKTKDDEGWAAARPIGNAINTPLNEGMAKLTVCGRTLYFAACGWDNGMGGCDIFQAKFDPRDGNIAQVNPAKGLNSKFWESQPTITCDGKTMYFASNREGGYGGTDIWQSTLLDNGLWSEPVNLGPVVNTPGDEEAPYIAPDGISLYFASDGHPGFGEQDIFRTEKLDAARAHWGVPINLGRSVNTPFREVGITVSPDGQTAYFASARPGGLGGLDIYRVALYRQIAPIVDNVMLEGIVFNAATGERIEGAKVKIGKTDQAKQTFASDAEGRFFICLPGDASYSYIVEKSGYETYIEANYFRREKDQPSIKLEIPLLESKNTVVEERTEKPTVVPKPVIQKNLSLYFESGKYELTDIQRSQIEQLVSQFEDKSKLRFRLTGFADDVGNSEFNVSLSQKRAGYVAQYLETLGVPKEQLSYDGKGAVESGLPAHQRRRVDLVILN